MSLKFELLSLLSNDLILTIIHVYVRWSLTGNRKRKNMCNFWPKKWYRTLKKLKRRLSTRELLKQYLTEKQIGCLRSGRLQEVVAYEKRPLHYERVDSCTSFCEFRRGLLYAHSTLFKHSCTFYYFSLGKTGS